MKRNIIGIIKIKKNLNSTNHTLLLPGLQAMLPSKPNPGHLNTAVQTWLGCVCEIVKFENLHNQ